MISLTEKTLYSLKDKRIFVAGHKGMVGSAIVRRLASEGPEILGVDRLSLDLTNQQATEDWLARMKPDAIFLAAGLVGGIHANNSYPADFITNNIQLRFL